MEVPRDGLSAAAPQIMKAHCRVLRIAGGPGCMESTSEAQVGIKLQNVVGRLLRAENGREEKGVTK